MKVFVWEYRANKDQLNIVITLDLTDGHRRYRVKEEGIIE